MCSDEEIIIENHSSPCLKPATQHNHYLHQYMLKQMQYFWNTRVCRTAVKGIVQTKMRVLSSFAHPHVVPNLHDFCSFAEHKKGYF